MKIPVYINNRNRLTTTRNLVEYLQQIPDARPIIVDNASSFPPLRLWYESCPVEIVQLLTNEGPRAPWQAMDLNGVAFYVVTDSDLDLTGVPLDVLDVLRSGLEEFPWAIKAGLSLRIDDLPDGYRCKVEVIDRETPMWADRIDERFYRADLDTTFAMYRVNPAWNGDYGPSLRAAEPYTARHAPWYAVEPYDDEERYYLDHATCGGIYWTLRVTEHERESKCQ